MRTRGIFQPYLSDYNNSKFVLNQLPGGVLEISNWQRKGNYFE